MCMKFKFISICTYLCGVCPMYCSFSNYFGPNVFGDHIVLECCFRYIGDALDAWFIHIEVWWPNNYWNQARVIEELLSTTPYQCYLGNKYLLMHIFFSSNLVGCILAWVSLFANGLLLAKILMKPLYCKCE
jgi:hypothetical protein